GGGVWQGSGGGCWSRVAAAVGCGVGDDDGDGVRWRWQRGGVVSGGWWFGRVEESGVWDLIDQMKRAIFGFAGKRSPEKFSGGGDMVAGGGEVAGVKWRWGGAWGVVAAAVDRGDSGGVAASGGE
nr:hypothetical protein [Tanacetum cinerariifolium]